MYLLAVTIFNDTRGNAELIKSRRNIFPQEKKYFFSPQIWDISQSGASEEVWLF